jgi:hypothetical protein
MASLLSRDSPNALEDQDTRASLVLTIGTLLWKLLSYWEHADFLLSIKEENFAVMFEFFDYAGWAILVAIGCGWLFWATKIKDKASTELRPGWAMAIACSVIAFLFGSLFALRASGGVPNVIASWGSNVSQCSSTIDTTRLKTFRSTYKIALICGIVDPSVDVLGNERVMISSPFEITPGGINIVTNSIRHPEKWSIPPGQQVSIWVLAVLLPSGVSTDKINTLQDVVNLGGKIISPQYWN